MKDDEIKGPFIVWEDWGYEGWGPTSFATLKEAVESRKTQRFVITRAGDFEVAWAEQPPA